MQHVFPQFDELFQQLHRDRTRSESLEQLAKVTGNPNFKPNELTRKDKYPDAYYGKEYGNNKALEVITMTGEALLGGDPAKFRKLMGGSPELAEIFLGAFYGFKF